MRGITIQQLLFLLLVIALPIIEQILKRRRQPPRPRVEPLPDRPPREVTYEDTSLEGLSYDDAVEEGELEPALPSLPPVVMQPKPLPVYIPPPPRPAPAPAPILVSPSQRRRPAPTLSIAEARRAVVLMEVLGPCVALR